MVRGKRLQLAFLKIDCVEDFGVRRAQGWQHASDASADYRVWEAAGRRLAVSFKRRPPSAQSAFFDARSAVVVDDRVAENAIEPGDGRLIVAQPRSVLQSAQIGVLKNVFGDLCGPDAARQKAEKKPSLRQQIRDWLL